jgi:hypothetical protein
MPPKKMYPQYWRRYRRHNRNPVNHLDHPPTPTTTIIFCPNVLKWGKDSASRKEMRLVELWYDKLVRQISPMG